MAEKTNKIGRLQSTLWGVLLGSELHDDWDTTDVVISLS